MKMLLLLASCVLFACTPSADNTTTRETDSVITPIPETDNKDPVDPTPDPAPQPVDPGEPPVKPEPEPQLKGCNNSGVAGSDHQLNVQLDPKSGRYAFDFKLEADRQIRVISLYVTDRNDEIPTFENGFKFEGTAYWMVSLDDPFETFFNLPMVYGTLPELGVDVTKNYKGLDGGGRLSELTTAKCLKITVITFEPDEDDPFKTSAFLQVHRP